MAWTNVTFPLGAILPASKLTQMQDNFDAVAYGAPGAPRTGVGSLDVRRGGGQFLTQLVAASTTVNLGAGWWYVHRLPVDVSMEAQFDGGAWGTTLGPGESGFIMILDASTVPAQAVETMLFRFINAHATLDRTVNLWSVTT